MRKKKVRDYSTGKGIAGHYVLNQKTQKFADRRTKRNRTRSAQKNREIGYSS